MMHLTVSGMTCDHCIAAVSRAVRAIPGTKAVSVDLVHGVVKVEGDPDPAAVRAAIVEEGYEVVASGT